MPKSHDLYEILEVSPRASEQVIQAAWRALIKIHTPDQQQAIAKELNAARDILLDDRQRQKYDQQREGNYEGKIVGNYRILELIAEGGFGKTYKAEHVLLGTPTCVKHCPYISPQAEIVMFEEAKAMWDLRHFGIPAIRDIVRIKENGTLALVMSYIDGPTLEQIVKKVGCVDPEHVSWIGERSLNVLKYLHHHGVVHGDVKPQNTIIQHDTHNIVLVDYGLSAIRPTKTTSPKGFTPYFAPPEQEDDKPLLPESDFYSLGMTLLYALGGDVEKRNFPRDTPKAMVQFITRLIVDNPMDRPRWEDEDLSKTIQKVREVSFGRTNSAMKPMTGI